ncbi:MAG: exodeoxyribonuclease V subunit alpha [Balneolaceae bacterium]
MMDQQTKVKSWYDTGVEKGWIGIYEQEMIRFLEEEFGQQPDEVKLCLVFTSLFVNAGHVCLPLDKAPAEWISLIDSDINHPDILAKQSIDKEALKASEVIDSDGKLPFTLTGNRLFISRYWWYETIVAQKLKEISSTKYESLLNKESLAFLNSLYPGKTSPEIDWQKAAAALALRKKFLLISGGPGTGKTTTIGKILALRLKTSEQPLRIALAAPTGKAAARMGDALQQGLSGLPLTDEELRRVPSEAKTVHRLLWGFGHAGLLPPAEKKYLPYDLIIVDEASMIDLTLMHRLLSHIKPGTQLILLGDKDQLASVEAGAVLADICKKETNGFSPETAEFLKAAGIENVPVSEVSDTDDAILYLEKSWRFGKGSGIGKLAGEVKAAGYDSNSGSPGQSPGSAAGQTDLFHTGNNRPSVIQAVFTAKEYTDLNHVPFSYGKEELQRMFEDIAGRLMKCRDRDPKTMFGIWQEEMWLSVLRHGPVGSQKLNWLIENYLARQGVTKPVKGWYHGRPVMVTRNDYALGVFNGDTGVCTLDENNTARIHFPGRDGFKRIRADRISHLEPAYVLTAHKSQGSEFEKVNLLLPKKDTPILTKELIYTAITRAGKQFTLYGPMELFEKGAQRRTERFTGLREKLA